MPVRSGSMAIQDMAVWFRVGLAYLLPTAALFLSDLSRRKPVTRIAIAARMMEPKLPSLRSPLSGIPSSSHPPQGPD